MALLMTIRLGTHVSLTITTIFQPGKQPTNSLRQRVVISGTLDSNLLIVLLITIRLCTNLSPTFFSDAAEKIFLTHYTFYFSKLLELRFLTHYITFTYLAKL